MMSAALAPGQAAIILFGTFFTLFLLRVPVAFALGLACLPILAFEPRLSPMMLLNETFKAYNSFILLAVPFYLLTASLMNTGGVTDRLVRLSRSMVGHFPGALAQINVLLSVFFAGISGSSTADAASQSKIFIDAQVKEGYGPVLLDRDHRGLRGARGDHPALDPHDRLGRRDLHLHRGDVSRRVPARNPHRRGADGDRARVREDLQLPGLSACDAEGVLLRRVDFDPGAPHRLHHRGRRAPRLVHADRIGGGGGDLHHDPVRLHLPRDELPAVLQRPRRHGRLSSIALFCVGTASAFGWLLAYYQIPRALLENVSTWGMGITQAGFFIAFVFLVVGCFLDAIPAIIIFGTILQPLAASVGMNPVHFAIIGIVSLAFGLVTPPYGLCLMISCAVAGVPIRFALKDTLIMLVPMILMLAAIIIWPDIPLILPRLVAPELLK
jgi:TRAP-type mannitol/chloroaromatic compound transport system permease large subunit